VTYAGICAALNGPGVYEDLLPGRGNALIRYPKQAAEYRQQC